MILGIDCSSRAVHMVALTKGDKIGWSDKVSGAGKLAGDRFEDIIRGMQKWNTTTVDFAAIERPLYFKNPLTTIAIAKVVAVVEYRLTELGISYKLVDNRVWKKEVLGNGNSSKDDIMKYATERWKVEFKEQDFADAACIAEWGRLNNGG